MKTIEKTLKILSVIRMGETITLGVQLQTEQSSIAEPPKTPKPENVIQPLPRSETEKIAREQAKATFDELKRLGAFPMQQPEVQARFPAQLSFSIPLSIKEYEKLGKPTVFDELRMKVEFPSG